MRLPSPEGGTMRKKILLGAILGVLGLAAAAAYAAENK
jgi:hypothetical protein